MGYYNNNRNNNRGNNRNNNRGNGRSHHGQSYIWVVYDLKKHGYRSFTSKVQALKYYYDHQSTCFSPDKRES